MEKSSAYNNVYDVMVGVLGEIKIVIFVSRIGQVGQNTTVGTCHAAHLASPPGPHHAAYTDVGSKHS